MLFLLFSVAQKHACMILLLRCSASLVSRFASPPSQRRKWKWSDESTASCEVFDEDTTALVRGLLNARINWDMLGFVP
jgi:hypothetical protein